MAVAEHSAIMHHTPTFARTAVPDTTSKFEISSRKPVPASVENASIQPVSIGSEASFAHSPIEPS